MSGHETDSLLPGHKTSPNAATPKAALKARRALALKIVVAICGATALAAVALPRANSGGLRASPAALKASALTEGKLLGGTEYNHIASDAFGPLKADHSAFCPGGLTHAEREEQCVSVQEHVWGTDGLARLEAIKAKLDPQGIFQCQKCVGFKGPVRDQ